MKHAPSAFLAIATLALSPAAALAVEQTPFKPAPLPPEQALFSFLPQKDPRIAAGLSLAVNGTGQFYNGETAKGWWCLSPVLAYPLAWALDSALGTGYFRAGDALLIIGTKVYSTLDAYRVADEAARRAPQRR
ncbi:hypothetical protein J7643_15370 [bacterium]|nr:hypothetical protein [bacterium]